MTNRGSKNGFINTLLGFGAGAPLGVCVNCAAPIAKGMHSAEKPFTRQQAVEIGIPRVNVLSPDEFISTYWNGRGIASGDGKNTFKPILAGDGIIPLSTNTTMR